MSATADAHGQPGARALGIGPRVFGLPAEMPHGSGTIIARVERDSVSPHPNRSKPDMSRRFALAVCAVAVLLAVPASLRADGPATKPAAAAPAERPVVKLSAKHPDTKEELIVLLDWNDAPAAEPWARKAGEYALKVYPQIEKALASDGYTPAREFRLLFKPVKDVPAYASGTTITINSDYIARAGREDFGMVGHELAHVIQRYRRGNVDSGWLTEGIADFVRYYVLEPGSPRARFDIDRAKFKDAYQPAAAFLDYLERTKGPGIVSKLNAQLRAGKYKPDLLKELVGGDPAEAFETFRAEARRRRDEGRRQKDKG